jgi:hypothetical protein
MSSLTRNRQGLNMRPQATRPAATPMLIKGGSFMAKVKDVCRHVRSKNAGPFWVTIDLFFDSPQSFSRYATSASLGAQVFASLYETDQAMVKHCPVPGLNVLKVSYPRPHPQGWAGERDMHQGQSFVRLLDVELD